MFGDLNSNGFDLESTHLHSFIRLSRLVLVVTMLYDWRATTGVKSIKAGLRHLVDRKDHHDLSIIQIGWRIINRRLINDQPVLIPLFPAAIPKVSGSKNAPFSGAFLLWEIPVEPGQPSPRALANNLSEPGWQRPNYRATGAAQADSYCIFQKAGPISWGLAGHSGSAGQTLRKTYGPHPGYRRR
jgi:hypothetical protein